LFDSEGYKKKVSGKSFKWSVGSLLLVIICLTGLQAFYEEHVVLSQISSGQVDPNSNKITIPGLQNVAANNNSQTAPNGKKGTRQYQSDFSLGPVIIQPNNFGSIPAG